MASIRKKNGKWHSLSQLRDFISENSKEKIVDFTGYELKTNKFTYALYDGIVTWKK